MKMVAMMNLLKCEARRLAPAEWTHFPGVAKEEAHSSASHCVGGGRLVQRLSEECQSVPLGLENFAGGSIVALRI